MLNRRITWSKDMKIFSGNIFVTNAFFRLVQLWLKYYNNISDMLFYNEDHNITIKYVQLQVQFYT